MVERKRLVLKVKKRQLADHLQVSTSTINNWMNKGILVERRHYIKIQNVVRFPEGVFLKVESHSRFDKPGSPPFL